MNTYTAISSDYLKASRTIETVWVQHEETKAGKLFFIYNYEGYSYRVFATVLALLDFFQNDTKEDFHFSTEKELDGFLSTVEIS